MSAGALFNGVLRCLGLSREHPVAADPIRFSLFAVLENDQDRDDVRAWLADIATAVPADLGIADEIEARDANGISLHLIETSYAADVAQLTWRPNQPRPDGAEPTV